MYEVFVPVLDKKYTEFQTKNVQTYSIAQTRCGLQSQRTKKKINHVKGGGMGTPLTESQ